MMTQNDMVLAYIKERGSITSMEAMVQLHIMRLASRINDLRQKGINIQSQTVWKKTGDGVKHWSVYTLAEEA